MGWELAGLSPVLVWPQWSLPFGLLPGAVRSSRASRVKRWPWVILGDIWSGLNQHEGPQKQGQGGAGDMIN